MEIEVLKWGAYVLVGVLGWLVRVLWEAQQEMRKDFSELERELPVYYVRRDEFKDVVRDIRESFKEAVHPVLTKLDRMEEKWEEHKRYAEETYQRKDKSQ